MRACHWTYDDLEDYGIHFASITSLDNMFDQDERNEPMTEDLQKILDSYDMVVNSKFSSDSINAAPLTIRKFWGLLRDVIRDPYEESKVDDFMVHLFSLAGIEMPPDILLHTRHELTLTMGKKRRMAKPDIYVVDVSSNHTILLVHEDKAKENPAEDKFPQVVAQSIAAFQNEQSARAKNHQPKLTHFPILLGVCHGTKFTFLRAIIPRAIANAVRDGTKLTNNEDPKVLLDIYRLQAFSFKKKDDLNKILACLSCWKHVIHNYKKNLKNYEVSSE